MCLAQGHSTVQPVVATSSPKVKDRSPESQETQSLDKGKVVGVSDI